MCSYHCAWLFKCSVLLSVKMFVMLDQTDHLYAMFGELH